MSNQHLQPGKSTILTTLITVIIATLGTTGIGAILKELQAKEWVIRFGYGLDTKSKIEVLIAAL